MFKLVSILAMVSFCAAASSLFPPAGMRGVAPLGTSNECQEGPNDNCPPGSYCMEGKCHKIKMCKKDIECGAKECCLSSVGACSKAPQPGDFCPLSKDVPFKPCPCGGGTTCKKVILPYNVGEIGRCQ